MWISPCLFLCFIRCFLVWDLNLLPWIEEEHLWSFDAKQNYRICRLGDNYTILHVYHAFNLAFGYSDGKEREWHTNDVEIQRLVLCLRSAFVDGISSEALQTLVVKVYLHTYITTWQTRCCAMKNFTEVCSIIFLHARVFCCYVLSMMKKMIGFANETA